MDDYQATGNRVLVELDPTGEEVLSSGIVIPDHPQGDAQAIGRVRSAGPNAYGALTVGCRVLLQPYRALAAWREGDGLLLMQDEDIFAVINEEEEASE